MRRHVGPGFDSRQVHQKENVMDDDVARFIAGVAILFAMASFFF